MLDGVTVGSSLVEISTLEIDAATAGDLRRGD